MKSCSGEPEFKGEGGPSAFFFQFEKNTLVVTNLELHRLCILRSINLIYGSNDEFSVCSLLLPRYNHTYVTCS